MPIICLSLGRTDPQTSAFTFASGSLNGLVVHWEVRREPGGILKTSALKEFPLAILGGPNSSIQNPCFQIQALVFRRPV